MSVNVLVADDDPHFRRMIRRLLEKEQEFRLIGEAEDGEAAVRLEETLRPELIFMDISMPRLDGLEATRRIKARRPEARVIILTVHSEEAYRKVAAECGADGFVLKKTLTGGIASTIRGPHAR